MPKTDVLIVGAGPTGLVLALWLTKLGVKVRIIDKSDAPGTTSRALGIQARTLELYRQLDLADAVVAAGRENKGINLWVKGEKKGRLGFGDAGASLTPYPFLLIFPQDQHERLLINRLEGMGVQVERRTEFLGFEDKSDGIVARLRLPDGTEQSCEASYLAGCDGARSPIRHAIGTGFEGGTYPQIFYVADVEVARSKGVADGEIHVSLETADFLALFSYGNPGQARLIGTVRDEREDVETLTFDDVGRRAIDALGLKIAKVNWFSTYRVHHRVTSRYRVGRAFLLGDSAHVHSPAGGQGMNTGIGDAINLAWKIAAVLKGEAPDNLLDSYETERKAFAVRLVNTTDRVFTFVSGEGPLSDFIRTRVAPILLPLVFRIPALRKTAFRIISQTMINYRASALSGGKAGKIAGGDRLPWVVNDGCDNFQSLTALTWQVHVYGTADPALASWCASRQIALHVFDFGAAHEAAGLASNAAYLLRPDTYVACAIANGNPAALEAYLTQRGIRRS